MRAGIRTGVSSPSVSIAAGVHAAPTLLTEADFPVPLATIAVSDPRAGFDMRLL
jgi:hypothetical protein